MGEFAIGQSVLRREDPRLLRGHGRFFDDLKPGIVATAPWNVFYLTGFNGIAHKSDEPRPRGNRSFVI
jgi:hypothetical protein